MNKIKHNSNHSGSRWTGRLQEGVDTNACDELVCKTGK